MDFDQAVELQKVEERMKCPDTHLLDMAGGIAGSDKFHQMPACKGLNRFGRERIMLAVYDETRYILLKHRDFLLSLNKEGNGRVSLCFNE